MISTVDKTLWISDIVLATEHIPGITNYVADATSRTWMDMSLLHQYIQENQSAMGSTIGVPIYNHSVQSAATFFFSWRLDPLTEATDSFSQQRGLRGA